MRVLYRPILERLNAVITKAADNEFPIAYIELNHKEAVEYIRAEKYGLLVEDLNANHCEYLGVRIVCEGFKDE